MCGLGQVFTAKGVRHKVQDFKNFIGSENVDRHADVVHRVWAAEIRVAECNKQRAFSDTEFRTLSSN